MTPYSALCKLKEYPGKEGMLHISEVSGKWVRDIRKFIKLNREYIVKVLRVDEQKGHIALSLKRVAKVDKTRKMQEYSYEKKAEKILMKIARKEKITLEKAYEQIGYELQEKFDDMFEAFKLAAESPDKLIKRGIEKKWAEIIHEVAKEAIQKKKIKIKAELNVKFYTGDGVERLKEFLNNLINKYGVNIKYISAPKYSVEIETINPKLAQKELIKHLTDAITNIKDGEADFKMVGEKE
jgi:translation initiation factor 2 subunit 1